MTFEITFWFSLKYLTISSTLGILPTRLPSTFSPRPLDTSYFVIRTPGKKVITFRGHKLKAVALTEGCIINWM